MCQTYKELVAEYEYRNVCPMWLQNRRGCHEKQTLYTCNHSTGLIVGGIEAAPAEFPHMAALGWKNQKGEIEYKCGGSLISDKFVLTAAHCLLPEKLVTIFFNLFLFKIVFFNRPTVVKLGSINVNSGDPSSEFSVKSAIRHEDHHPLKRINDIALIELMQPVKFSTIIRPACLSQVATVEGGISGRNLTAVRIFFLFFLCLFTFFFI